MSRQISLHHHGAEQQPLICVDEFLPHPQVLRDFAAERPFEPMGPHYPGLRYPLPAEGVMPMLRGLEQHIADAFELTRAPRFREAFFSLVTTAPKDLTLIQRLPHFDGLEPERLAVLVFLSPSHSDGTAFYRHRATRLESVDQTSFAAFEAQLSADLALHGEPPPGYIYGNTAIYEQTAMYEGLYNRALIYRGNALHCAHLPPNFVADPDPTTGRLTLNLFLD